MDPCRRCARAYVLMPDWHHAGSIKKGRACPERPVTGSETVFLLIAMKSSPAWKRQLMLLGENQESGSFNGHLPELAA